MSLPVIGYVWGNGRADASSRWYWMEREEFVAKYEQLGPVPVPSHFIPLVPLKNAQENINKLLAELAPYRAEAERRNRERGDYWLSPEGRATLKKTFDDREDGNAVRPLLDRVEELERYIHRAYIDTFEREQ